MKTLLRQICHATLSTTVLVQRLFSQDSHTLTCSLLILGLTFGSSASLYAQRSGIRFEHISLGEDLSQSKVTSIIQDHVGFLWIGTEDGLGRYDGNSIKVYRHIPGNPNSLSHNSVQSIHEDNSGTLWIGTFGGGLNRFDREKEQFTHYKHEPSDPNSLSNDYVLSVYEDKSGFLWIGTNGGGINRFDTEAEEFIHYEHDLNDLNSLSYNIVRGICEDKSGILWIGTDGGGLNRLDRDKKQFTHYKHEPRNPNSLSHNYVLSIIEDRSGDLWLGTMGGGLDKFDREKEQFTHYRHEPDNPNSLSGNTVESIYEDKAGILWIGTGRGGLNKFDKEKEQFTHYKHEPDNPNSLSDSPVESIHEDKFGMLWIGTDGGGLNRFDREKEKFTHYEHEPNNPNSLSDNQVFSIVEDRSGMLWIGTLDGLNKFDRKKRKFTHYKHEPDNPNSLSHNLAYSIIEDRSGVLWVGTYGGGLDKIVLSGKEGSPPTFTHYQSDPNNPSSLSNDYVMSVYEDNSGVLWIGTEGGGLNRFDREKEEFTHYKHEPNNPNSLSYNSVHSILEDKSGVLWIGTAGGGLNRLEKSGKEISDGVFRHYTEKDGLAGDVIYGILEDDNGSVWVSTRKGLSRFNPDALGETEQVSSSPFRNYDAADGLQSNEFRPLSCCKSRTGEMFFGGIGGFNAFHPDSLKDNLRIPPIVLTDFTVTNNPVELDTSITERRQILLSYKENFFSFQFAALDYTAPQKNNYAYKLEGLDEDWVYIDNRHYANYTDVEPGEYIFRVKGSNNNDIWNEEGASVRIIITPPWWRTDWAYAVYVVLAGALLYGVRRFDLNRQRMKHQLEMEHMQAEKLQELDRLKSRFFANISHEFRTPLTLIQGPVEKMRSGEFQGSPEEQYGMILRNTRRLERLINQLLDLSKLEAGRMILQARPGNIVNMLKGLVHSFASQAERKRITLTYRATEDSIIAYVDWDKLEKIVSNLLSNALKFTADGGKVHVTVSTTDKEFLKITVTDTGIGIPPGRIDKIFDRFYQGDETFTREQEGTGIGLALTKELVELHKGEISVSSDPGKGSTFVVRLPLGKRHLKSEEITEEPVEEMTAERLTDDHAVKTEVHEASQEQWAEEKEQAAAADQSEPRLLIVEDNADVRSYMRSYLDKDYRIVEANDGLEGLETAIEQIPDLIISDVMMPKMDGFEFCKKLKTDERTSHIPVILLTARASSESKVEGLETGADDYIIKPFDAKELQVRVRNLIEQRRKLRERFRREVTLKPKDIAITSADERFLNRAVDIIEQHMPDPEFTVEAFAQEICMSRMQLHRKIRALTNQAAGEFVRTLRLQRAAQLLQQRAGTVSEIAYQVGYESPSRFAEAFRGQFGQSPSEFAQGHTQADS